MSDLNIFTRIGSLLNDADRLHLYYYTSRKISKKDIPSQLVGGIYLQTIINNPLKGLKILRKRINPFIKYCDAKRKSQSEDWRLAYGIMNNFITLFDKIMEEVRSKDIKKCVKMSFQNELMINYFFKMKGCKNDNKR